METAPNACSKMSAFMPRPLDVNERWWGSAVGSRLLYATCFNTGLAPSAPVIPRTAPLWRTSPINLCTYRSFRVTHMRQGGKPPASHNKRLMADETKGRWNGIIFFFFLFIYFFKSQVPKLFSFETQKWNLVSPQDQKLRKHIKLNQKNQKLR